eukprot:s5844_g2.t1
MQAGSQVIAGALRKAGESEGKDVALCTLALQGLRPGKCSDAAPESSRFFIFVATGLTACVPTLLFKLLVARRPCHRAMALTDASGLAFVQGVHAPFSSTPASHNLASASVLAVGAVTAIGARRAGGRRVRARGSQAKALRQNSVEGNACARKTQCLHPDKPMMQPGP